MAVLWQRRCTICLVLCMLWAWDYYGLRVSCEKTYDGGASDDRDVAGPSLSAEKSLVFGPGVSARQGQLPITYFYIQAVDESGRNMTNINSVDSSITKFFDIRLEAVKPQARVIHRRENFYLGSGLFLCAYRMLSDHRELTLSIMFQGQHVADSPYKLRNAFQEGCACALRSADQWLEDFECPNSEPQVEQDLLQFKSAGINISDLYERGGKQFPHNSFIHYSIIDNKLYAQSFGSIVGFKYLSDMILLSIVNKVRLPNMELLVNLGDWPLNKKGKNDPSVPVFSWCGSSDSRDIVWPTWDLMKSTIMGMDRVSLTMLTAQKTREIPWKDRLPIAYFRGRDSNQARLSLVQQHRNDTELFDVGIVAFFFFEHKEELYGPIAKRVGFHDFFKFRYQLNIDGTVAAYRLPFLMSGGSLVFKQDSDYYEHFYRMLLPWKHYVPMGRDLRDVVGRVEWARDNDAEAQEIVSNSLQFVQDHLLPDRIYCYIARLLKEYAGLQVLGSEALAHPGMALVEPEVPLDCSSVCPQENILKDEL